MQGAERIGSIAAAPPAFLKAAFPADQKKEKMLFSNTAADDTNRVRIKMCGLTLEDDVLTAVQAGADAVGFVCYPASARYVTPSRLICLLSLVPPSVTKVLVFVNPKSEEVREHLTLFPDCVLQFHGTESRAFCDQFHKPYIKTVAVRNPEDLLRAQDEYPMAAALLADSPVHKTDCCALPFDWEGVGRIRDAIRKPLIVAGGLKEVNVSQAIRLMRPWAVDVAAGVETARGVKDHDKIEKFVQAVRRGGDCGELPEDI